MVAAIIGGAIALFAAEPVSQQFGIALAPPPKVPVEIEQRLASLETKQAGSAADPALRDEISKVASQVASARERLTKLEDLRSEVQALSEDVKSATASESASANGAPQSASEDNTAAEQLRQRLAKLESTISTLSSATAANGEPSGMASLAQFSAKFADLENTLNTQLDTLRKNLMSEMDTRLTSATDVSQKAVVGAERIDREVSEIKNETARLEQRAKVIKSATEKLSASMTAVSDQAAELKVELDTLKDDLKQQLTKVARPDDVQKAIAPVSQKIATIEKNLESVLANETARKANAERIVLSLELSNLKRVLERGAPYAAELADVKQVAGEAINFDALEAHKNEGVPTGQELTRRFRDVAYLILNAEETPADDASRIDRLLAAAKSIVQVRRTDLPAKEKTTEAAIARIEKLLKEGDMSGALAVAEELPDKVKGPASTWISQLAARANVERAIAKIEDQLKASLGGTQPKG